MRQLRDWFAAITLAGLLIAAIVLLPGETVEGRVRVIDGDSLVVAGREIRLYGIDAPEARQTCRTSRGAPWACGRAATRRLAALVGDGTVRCVGEDTDRYGRLVARCRVDETDVNAAMVTAGLALAYTALTRRYSPQEAAARHARRGVWVGEFEPPWRWRRRHPVSRNR